MIKKIIKSLTTNSDPSKFSGQLVDWHGTNVKGEKIFDSLLRLNCSIYLYILWNIFIANLT